MSPIWIIILIINLSPAQAVDFSRPSYLSVKSGEHVILNCPFGDIRRTDSVVWYKESVGEMPQKVGERLIYKDIKMSPKFNTSGYKMEMTNNGISLRISRIKKEDEGLYYCGKCMLENVTLSNGTFLAVADDRDVKVSVWQRGVSDSVPAGASVTLQCSVLSESRAAELQVLWFRAAPPQSHPQIIYTHHNSSHQCEIDSSTHTCVYNFSKNILSLNDTGTYYCAVLLCGKIIFGNGTRIQMENLPKYGRSLSPDVIYLSVLALCVVVIFTQAFIIFKRRLCGQCRVRHQQNSVVEKTPNQVNNNNDKENLSHDPEYLKFLFFFYSYVHYHRVMRRRSWITLLYILIRRIPKE
ncbi:uncharacterized protein LOC113645974 isoform X1 [Tachysurus fulvidraco]|uniref:uncharacterized protein LOC113645974 isoform X1 n=1 Tax=Tachysurus fulvidraco TaxID=1234273 RepID=UPI001FED7AD9|nr:uncharacterized protein LOC113645974 isoform X1 [Tachysurus fulvidraco]